MIRSIKQKFNQLLRTSCIVTLLYSKYTFFYTSFDIIKWQILHFQLMCASFISRIVRHWVPFKGNVGKGVVCRTSDGLEGFIYAQFNLYQCLRASVL